MKSTYFSYTSSTFHKATVVATIIFIISCFPLISKAQYSFTTDKMISCTEVKNQQKTNTCWSYATTSFIESELLRVGKGKYDLSEMFVVKNIFKEKAYNYVMRQGKANFAQGGLSHDVIRAINKYGFIPENQFSGLSATETIHDHSELERGLKSYLDGILKRNPLSQHWQQAVDNILDAYLGISPTQFEVNNETYTPKSFFKDLGLSAEDYISITSFTHSAFYEKFILELPDNFSNGMYYNIPLEELVEVIDYALISGYSISWDGDVSESSFDGQKGIAVLPVDTEMDCFSSPVDEIIVTQNNRQAAFESHRTTDDHLMHIVGLSLDQNGTKYYVLKNSWGKNNPYQGYIYMSESYLKMKTISITMHKEGLPEKASRKLLSSN